jgi:pimeloyl-ACP methyl ester carboxylesterase
MKMMREVLPGVVIHPRVIETSAGPVEFDLTAGDGPVVLASHGGIGGVDQARLLLGWLDPDRYRLLSVSRPGYLGTPLTSGRALEQQADTFAALLDALDLPAAAMVAVSAGGPPGYLFAARHPDRVWALVAIAGVSGTYRMPETAGPLTEAMFMSSWGQRLTRHVARRRPAWMVRQILRSLGHYTRQEVRAHADAALRSPEAVAFVQGLLATMDPYAPRKPGLDNDMAVLARLTHAPVEQVRCPTLVVHGTHDADVKFADGVYAYEHIPGAERVWVEQGSHLAFWLGPHADRVQIAARRFLERHRPSSALGHDPSVPDLTSERTQR